MKMDTKRAESSNNVPEKFLTPEEAANLLHVSQRTVYKWLRTKQIPATQIGRFWHIRESDVLTPDVKNLLEQGLIFDAEFNVEQAARAFSKALEINPKYNLANFCLGTMYYRWSHFSEAETPLKKAIELNPKWVAAYINLGMNYNRCWRAMDAEIVFKKAIKLFPSRADTHYELGIALFQQYIKDEEAIDAFNQAIKLDHQHVMAYHFLGWALVRANKLKQANELCNKLKGLYPHQAEWLSKLIHSS